MIFVFFSCFNLNSFSFIIIINFFNLRIIRLFHLVQIFLFHFNLMLLKCTVYVPMYLYYLKKIEKQTY